MNLDIRTLYLVTFFLVINLLSFLMMLIDKAKSANPGAERISEGLLFFMAAAFGSLGVYAGMFIFHHKSRKWYFLIGVPLIILQNLAMLYLIYLSHF
ncbi:MAG: DUF1294 domain-containing protein [Candidatus Falkowbacteria bacterium]